MNLTYLFISHDLSVVKFISDRIGVMYLGNMVEFGSKKDIFSNPLHPYTKALFSAIPNPNPDEKMNRIVLKGDIPSPANPPSGCRFHTRCPYATEKCAEIVPEYKEYEKGHFAACHLLEEKEELDDRNLPALPEAKGNIKFENVDFSYVPERPLIEGFNLDVKEGEHIAIVGPTGAGKSTLINLLIRFYDVTGGKLTVDGRSVDEVTRKSLRTNYGMVLQETWLREGTVRDNIAMGKPDASFEEIVYAARRARADDFITKLSNGYNTVIGSGGASISQGQMQLICIARVILQNPKILILDEATSSIDTRTEIKISEAMDEMMAGKTSFIVAHRLSTVQNADKILVMNDGAIVESGKHDELLAKGGFYAKIYMSQFAV
jgi:oligopeptide/dipeptide ABC transporter ATP-binding protein